MPLSPLAFALGWLLLTPVPPTGPDLADLSGLATLRAPGSRARVAHNADAAAVPATGMDRAEYVVEASGRSQSVFLLPAGPRTIVSLSVEPSPETAEAWRTARLRLTWEDDDPAVRGVDLPLGLAFGRVAPGAGLGRTLLTGQDGAAWVNRFPMPYRDRALLRIDTERPLMGRIRLTSRRGVDPNAGYFRGESWPLPSGDATASVAVRGEGRGHIVGCLVLADRGAAGVTPWSLGRLVLDGVSLGPAEPALGLPRPGEVGDKGESRGLFVGTSGTSAAFCWLRADPLPYDRLFVVESSQGKDAPRHAGSPASRNAVATAALFWYSERPGIGAAQPGVR